MKLSEFFDEGKRIPRKKGQPAGSKKHSDLYTDENPKGTIQGLKFATVKDAKASVSKIRNSGKKHAHKIQAAVAMEQRAKAAGKSSAAAVYRSFINQMKKKTKKMNEGEERQIIHRATVDKLVDNFENRVDNYDTLPDLHDAIYNELSTIIAVYFLSTIVADQIASAILVSLTNASPLYFQTLPCDLIASMFNSNLQSGITGLLNLAFSTLIKKTNLFS